MTSRHLRVVAALPLWLFAISSAAQPTGRTLDPCLAKIRATRAARAVTPQSWSRYASGLTADTRVIDQLQGQPEFRLPVWDYLAVMVDQERIDDGTRNTELYRATLDRVKAGGVDDAVVAAIWGIESNFGRGQGTFSVIRSLATLSCEGRRQGYFTREFLAALRILQRGHIAPDAFLGSWAGAFGQTQFMPGTFEWLAVDFDRDGRVDVIGSASDALGSAAAYLKRAGWRAGVPWGFEVRLPPALAAGTGGSSWRTSKRPLTAWAASGATRADGAPLVRGDNGAVSAGLLAPAGPRGPLFLVTRNFEAIYRYNASTHYALAIAHLADRLTGGVPLATPWPTDDPGLSRADRRELQQRLMSRGHPIGAVTGLLTPETRDAVRAEQSRLGMEATGRPGQRILQALRGGR